MNIKELIDLLSKCDPETIIIMSSDGEGNSHSPLDSFFHTTYSPNSTWSGEIGTPDGVPCIVLEPVN